MRWLLLASSYLVSPKVLVKVGIRVFCLFIYFSNSFIGYYSYNTSTIIQHTIKIESIRYTKNNYWERKADIKSRGPNGPGANSTPWPLRGDASKIKKGNKVMNIEIGNTIQTFELLDEIIWHLKKKTRFKIIRLLFSQTPQIFHNISRTVLKEPILWLLSVLLRSFQNSWNLLFFLTILFS